jgi:hypothetical protein
MPRIYTAFAIFGQNQPQLVERRIGPKIAFAIFVKFFAKVLDTPSRSAPAFQIECSPPPAPARAGQNCPLVHNPLVSLTPSTMLPLGNPMPEVERIAEEETG